MMVIKNIGSRILTKDDESNLDTVTDLFMGHPSGDVLEIGWKKGHEFSRVEDQGRRCGS